MELGTLKRSPLSSSSSKLEALAPPRLVPAPPLAGRTGGGGALRSSSSSLYRLYVDSWGVTSHTIETRLTKEFTAKLSLGVSLRYYTQGKARFYQDYYQDSTTPFYTGNNTLASYNSLLFGLRPALIVSDHIQLFAKLEDYEIKFSDAVDAYQLTTKADDKPLAISAQVIGFGLDAKF